MSLQLAAQHLASKGRGPDTTLVHMTPREVAGLQALARAHGGSLSVNPDTGLPEAGFLSSILPMIAGVALGPAGLGLTAMQAAMATGAVGALATGDLRKGLMAGLGAYGGAGLAGSIAGIGGVTGEAVSPTVGAAMNASAAPAAMPVTPDSAGFGAYYENVGPGSIPTTSPVTSSVVQGTALPPAYLNGMVDPFGGFPGGAPAPATATAMPTVVPAPAVEVAAAAPAPAPAPEAAVDTNVNPKDRLLQRGEVTSPAFVPPKSPFENFKSGLGAVMEEPSKLFTKENAKYGLAALAPFMLQEQKKATYQGSGPNPYQYTYNPGRLATPTRTGDQGQYAYFNPSYTRMAEGGTVESMSDRNAAETFVANGGQLFAEGGDVGTPAYSYIYDPITKTYRDPSKAQPVTTVTQMPGVSSPTSARGYVGEPGPVTAGGPDDGNIGWDNLSLDQKAEYYASHPVPAAITQFGQGLFGLTSLGQLQNAIVPDFVHAQHLAAQGLMPSNYGYNQGLGYSSLGNLTAGQYIDATNTPGITSAPVGGVGLHATPAGGIVGGLGINPSATGLGLTTAGANLANSGYSLTAGPSSGPTGPTGADEDDAAMGDAIAAAAASDAVAASDASSGVDGGGGDGGGGDGGGDGEKRGGVIRKARGGLSAISKLYNLGDYSDGGRLLKGPGDGVSDSIPAVIANKRPARLADGEFVIPARIVSELGNGSTNAGAKKLYAMMDRIQKGRSKSVGKGKVAVNSRSDKYLPA